MPDDRVYKIIIYVSKEEKESLELVALKTDLSVQDYIRTWVLGLSSELEMLTKIEAKEKGNDPK